jgi:hypothetical protein
MRTPAVVVAIASVAWLGGCGVTGQGKADRIEDAQVPFDLLAPAESVPPSVPPAAGAPVIYLVSAERLVPVVRVQAAPDAATLVGLLAAGPTDDEAAAGIRTALADGTLIGSALSEGPLATVELASGFSELPRVDQLLAVAQLTFTLTELPGVSSVEFRRDDTDLNVPREDGSVSPGPVGREDYDSLVD